MFGLSDAHHFRKLIAGCCMVAAPLLLLIGTVLHPVVFTSVVLGIIGAAFLFVGLGSIGRMVLSESDEAWEHTPEISGFRPLPGMR
jgi:hypothetical protein